MPYSRPDALVSTKWLAEHLDAPDIRVVDASYFLPDAGRDAKAEFAEEHITGAVFFDIDDVCDDKSPLPHMLPSPEKFSSRMRKLGVGDGNRVVVYDSLGMFSAARVWWMFRVFGHTDVAVLDGGLPKWKADGHPVTDQQIPIMEKHFSARMDNMLVRSLTQIQRNVDSQKEQLVDARPSGRFTGKDPEVRPGLRSGHIPGAINVPLTSILNPEDKTMLKDDALRSAFKDAGVDLGKPIATTCGSGVTACGLALGLYLLGQDRVPVYDGSWTEWGAREDLPLESGS